MSAGQMDAMRKEAHKQFSKPEARAQLLQQMVLHRVLAREARDRKLDQSPDYKARLVDQADNLLASQLMSAVASERATVTPEDVQRFYAANAKRYETPARGTLARIVCETKEDAAKVIELLDGGASFEKLAQDRSTDPETKQQGGKLDEPILPAGDEVPGAGDHKELHAKLWKLEAGDYTKESCQVDDEWHVYRMVDKQPARTPTLDQIRDRVEADCRAARRNEVMQQFVDEMLRKYDVKFHGGALAAATQPADAKGL
jgi:peptidyl-prolyl cis-trans isomerase C